MLPSGTSQSGKILLLLCVIFLALPADCFLFGRSEVVEPISVLLMNTFAIVNATERQAVMLSFESAYGFIDYAMTVTSSFNSQHWFNDMFVVRAIEGSDNFSLAGGSVFVNGNDVWCLTSKLGVTRISMTNATIMESILPLWNGDSIRDWQLGTHVSGARFPVLHTQDSDWDSAGQIYWTLPNGTNASVWFPAISAYALVGGNQLYVLALDEVDISINVTHIDLEYGTTYATGPATPNGNSTSIALSQCTMELDGGIGFLAVDSITRGYIITLNTTDLSLSSSPLALELNDKRWGEETTVTCVRTAVLGEYLVSMDVGNNRVCAIFLLNLTSAMLAPYMLPHSLAEWLQLKGTPEGDILGATCVENGQYSLDCQLVWLPAFNASNVNSNLVFSTPLGAPSLTFLSSAQTSDNVAVIMAENSLTQGPAFGFLVVDMNSSPRVTAWIGFMPLLPPNDHFSVDPVSHRFFFSNGIFTPDVAVVYCIDWHNPASIADLAAEYPVPDELIDDYYDQLQQQFYYQDYWVVLFPDDEVSITLWVIPLFASINDSRSAVLGFASDIAMLPNSTFMFANATGLHQWDFATLTELRIWPFVDTLASHAPAWQLIDSAMTPDDSTLYWVQWDGNATLACMSVRLSAPNCSIPLHTHVLTGVEFEYYVSAKAVLANGHLFVGMWFRDYARILKYSLNCSLLTVFDTQVPTAAFRNAVISRGDVLYFGQSPDLAMVYLDCGEGAYRNLSSGACSACPSGSVNAQADTQACMPCPSRTGANAAMTSCVCSAGFYSAAQDANCGVCPIGGVCLDHNNLLPSPGYWRASTAASYFYRCPFSTHACNGSDTCVAAYTGPLCAVCEEKHALVAGLCRHCSSFLASVGFWLLAALIYLAVFLLLLYPGGLAAVSVLKSFISFAQVVTFPASGPMPHLLITKFAFLGRFLSLANFQLLSIFSPDCLFLHHISFPITAVSAALLPILFILLVLFIVLVPWHRALGRLIFCFRTLSGSPDTASDSTPGFADRFEAYKRSGTPLRVMLFIVLLATPSCTQQLASFFTCSEVAEVMYLVRDYTVQCYHGLWLAFAAPVSILLALYAFGVPAGLFTLLCRYRENLDLRFLHGSYKDEYYWWDITEQLRKLSLLMCNAVLAPRAPDFYGPIALAISMIAICAHLQLQPYKSSRDTWFQTADLSGVLLYFLWAFTPQEDRAADVLAWVYWIYAICYALASVGVMLWPLAVRLRACGRGWCCGSSDNTNANTESELDPLMPRAK